jgi:hypothetical protein
MLNLRLNFEDLHVPSTQPLRVLCFVDLTNMAHSSVSSEDINQLCKRFRVLIIGRRNAGKTTILENMTGSEEGAKPEIRDQDGDLVVRAGTHISNIDSQADGNRTTPRLSRQGWRSVESISTSIYSSPH